MEERSTTDVEFGNNDNDDEVRGQIEGYNSPPPPSSSMSSSTQGTSSKGRHQRKDGDDQLDEEDFERILSRTTARRLLALFEAPEFVQRLRAYDEVESGGTVTFVAQYRATPTPTVKWFKDEEEVRATERHQLDADQTDGIIRLTIRDVVDADEGAYKCKVENREGVASTTGYLSVAGKRSTRSGRGGGGGGAAGVSGTAGGGKTPAAVSTPPYLGPIAEQKSMEEREEMELKRQPPSPLQHFIDSIRHSATAKHAPIYYGTKDLLDGQPGHNDDDDVVDDSTTPTPWYSRDAETESPADIVGDVDSRYHHRQSPGTVARNADAVCRACSTEDDGGDDRQPSTSVSVDLERRQSGFQRRRLGQLQLKHRLAVDLPEHGGFTATLRTQPEEPGDGLVVAKRRGNYSGPAERRHDVVFGMLWKSLDDPECQFFVVFVVVLATLAAALDIPAAWLVLAVACLSLLYFVVDDRRRINSQ